MTTTNPEGNTVASPALMEMIRKLDNRPKGNNGYVTKTPELMDILNELSRLVPVAVLQDYPEYAKEMEDDLIHVTVKVGFCLSRKEMQELQEEADRKRAEENNL